MPLPHMAPLWLCVQDSGAIVELIFIVAFIFVILIGALIYKLTEKSYCCQHCGETMRTHVVVENCPVCGSPMRKE